MSAPLTGIQPGTLSWAAFEERFDPLAAPDGTLFHNSVHIGRGCTSRHWWTLVEEDGVIYVCAGMRFVNRIGYLHTRRPWADAEQENVYFYIDP